MRDTSQSFHGRITSNIMNDPLMPHFSPQPAASDGRPVGKPAQSVGLYMNPRSFFAILAIVLYWVWIRLVQPKEP